MCVLYIIVQYSTVQYSAALYLQRYEPLLHCVCADEAEHLYWAGLAQSMDPTKGKGVKWRGEGRRGGGREGGRDGWMDGWMDGEKEREEREG